MNRTFMLIMLAGTFFSAISQVLLKQSANMEYKNPLREYLNWRVILAYGIFFGVLLLNTWCYTKVDMKFGPVIDTAAYVFVLLFSWQILKEKISRGKIIGNLVVPISFALLLNEIRVRWFKRAAQTITYLPYFLSWVVLGGILIKFLSPGSSSTTPGLLNTLLVNLHIIKEPIYFLGSNSTFRGTMIISDIWKNFGYNTIIYLAALTGIDPTLYEAAMVDGAGKIKQTIHVTMPGIAPFIALMTIMSIGSVLNAGFDQIFNLYSPAVYATGDIIDTLVYRLGLINQQYSLSAAVGLLKSVVSCILVLTGYKLADKYAGYKVW